MSISVEILISLRIMPYFSFVLINEPLCLNLQGIARFLLFLLNFKLHHFVELKNLDLLFASNGLKD